MGEKKTTKDDEKDHSTSAYQIKGRLSQHFRNSYPKRAREIIASRFYDFSIRAF